MKTLRDLGIHWNSMNLDIFTQKLVGDSGFK
jgi:hypothetical protein